jgi:transposase
MERDVKKGVHLDVPTNGFAGRLEVIEGPTGRRQRTQAEKARIVAESLMPGVRVSEVARKYGATRWQI